MPTRSSRRLRPRSRPPRASKRTTTPLGTRLRLFLPGRSWRVQLVGAAIGVAVAIFSAQSLASARESAATYLIQPGDTLLGIAASTGVSVDRIIGLNGIKNPDVIIAGQNLQLNGASAPPAAGSDYVVKPGDTLWDISRSTHVSVETLIKANNLSDANSLTVGQHLALAGAGQVAATAPAPRRASPQPTPTPQASPLQQRLAAEALRVGGPGARVGLAATNLVTGERVALHADDVFPSASVMKLPILVELERQVAAGALGWSDSLRNEASAMIAVSDNTAANEVADTIHPQSVNDTMSRLGLGSTRFMNPFNDARTPANPGQNQTTPANMSRLLEMIATDQVVSPQVSADIRGLLARNTDGSKLVRLLPGDAKVAHKSGWYDGVANDAGIVSVDRVPTRWVIAVFTQNVPDAETGNQLVAALSKLIYDAWAP